MCHCDDNAPEAYREEVRKAAKNHTCWECRGVIEKGDLYKVCSGVWDGRGDSYKWCHDCATIANLAKSVIGSDFCFLFGDLITCVEEAFRSAGEYQ